MLASDAGGLPYLIKQVLGDGLGTVFLVASAVAIFVCTLAVHANTARVLFAMARDRAVPFADRLGRVHPEQKSPLAAAVVVGVLGAGLLLVNVNFEKVMSALVCVAIVWANLAYLLDHRPAPGRPPAPPGRPRLVPRPVGVARERLAVVWGVLLVVNIGWPRARLYGDEWYQQYGAPLFTGLLLLAGLAVFAAVRPDRRRGGGGVVSGLAATPRVPAWRRALGWAVHAYTGSGLLLAAWIAAILHPAGADAGRLPVLLPADVRRHVHRRDRRHPGPAGPHHRGGPHLRRPAARRPR